MTEAAVKEFQKSVGVVVDGKCGPATIIGLLRLTKIVSGGAPAALRESANQKNRGPALANKVIVIDPGSADYEKEIVYDIAQRLEGRLLALGASVFLTRGTQNNPTEAERIAFTNENSADLMISLHIDKHANPDAHGVATFFYGNDQHGVHSIVGERFASLVQRELCARTDFLNCRAHAKTWDQLRLTSAPQILAMPPALPEQNLEIPSPKASLLPFSVFIYRLKMMQRLERYGSLIYVGPASATNKLASSSTHMGDFCLCQIFQFAIKPVRHRISRRDLPLAPPVCCHLKFARSSQLHPAQRSSR
jgi:hypothetical protein